MEGTLTIHQDVGVITSRDCRRVFFFIQFWKGHTYFLSHSTGMIQPIPEGGRNKDGLCHQDKLIPQHSFHTQVARDDVPLEAEGEESQEAREYLKVEDAVATEVSASLRGQEVLQLHLAGMQEHIGRGKGGILPPKPLEVGTDLTYAQHVLVVLIGHFMGETGIHHHMVSLASMSMSGINLRWWLEKLIEVQ
jgi:hypothetical protein